MKPQILSEMLRTIKRDNPGASEKEIKLLCRDKIFVDIDLRDALFEYWFSNSSRDFSVVATPDGVTVLRNSPPKRVRDPKADAERRAAQVAEMKARIVSRLMQFQLSDGTELRHATFGQCRQEGSWLAAIGELGKAHEVVGKKLTEADVASLRQRFDARAAA